MQGYEKSLWYNYGGSSLNSFLDISPDGHTHARTPPTTSMSPYATFGGGGKGEKSEKSEKSKLLECYLHDL